MPTPISQDIPIFVDDATPSSQTPNTQSTQAASPSQALQQSPQMDAHLWGYLQPCSPRLTRIDFWRIKPRFRIGRNAEGANDVVFRGNKVSNKHCVITWDEREDRTSVVTVQDLSSNGTFINGDKIGRGNTSILREGNELAIGSSHANTNNPAEDYRFIYRHTAAGPPLQGLYAFYDIATELGKGSFATVVRAINRADGQWYAVKMIQTSKMKKRSHVPRRGDGQERARDGGNDFLREITILETLQHPNICQLKEVFWDDATINLVLELVDGGDLLEYIIKNNGIEEQKSRRITYQMCDALAYIHSKGIAHRDLKPENVLLTSSEPPIVKVADFGLAKVVDSMTMLRTMCGTPSYLAPEVVTQVNQEGYDQLVDSWSVGVIVFSMLSNSSPFIEDPNETDPARRIRTRYVEWGLLRSIGVTHAAEAFCRKLLEVDPTHRLALHDALNHVWLHGFGTSRHQSVDHIALDNTPDPDEAYIRETSALIEEGFVFVEEDGEEDEDDELMLKTRPKTKAKAKGKVSVKARSSATTDTPVRDGLEHLRLGGAPSRSSSSIEIEHAIPGAFTTGPPAQRPRLQRRTEAIAQAQEEPNSQPPLLEPSTAMLEYAELSQAREARRISHSMPLPPATMMRGAAVPTNSKKRGHSQVSPAPEGGEVEVEEVVGFVRPPPTRRTPAPRKRQQAAAVAAVTAVAAAAAAMVVAEDAAERQTPPPRRSTREKPTPSTATRPKTRSQAAEEEGEETPRPKRTARAPNVKTGRR